LTIIEEKIVNFQMCARLFAAAGLVLVAWSANGDVGAKYAEPEDGAVKNSVFQDDYFGIRIRFRPVG
jgi:hypothetical protein